MIHGMEGSMAEVARKDWTYETLVAAGLDPRDYEIVDGELVEVAPMSVAGGAVISKLARMLGGHVEESGSGRSYVALRVLLSEAPRRRERRPDLAVVSNERLPAASAPYFEGGPCLVVEVLSPSDPSDATRRKLVEDYFPAGTREGWVVDPALQTITALRPGEPPRAYDRSDVLETDLAPGLRLSLDALFSVVDR